MQAPLAAQVTRRVDDGLHPQGAAVFEVLLDPGVLVEGVDGHVHAAGDDLGLELPGGRAGRRTCRSKMISMVSGRPRSRLSVTRASKKAAGIAGLGEHDRAGHLDLGHRALPPVARPAGRRGRAAAAAGAASAGRTPDRAGLQHVADPLQQGRIVAGGKAVGQLGEGKPGLAGLLLGPLMAVDPDFHRPGAVRADLDERRPEARVPQIEVVDRDPAVFLAEGELRALGRVGVTLAGDEHPLHLLGHPDRRDLGPAACCRLIQVGRITSMLRSAAFNGTTGM